MKGNVKKLMSIFR